MFKITPLRSNQKGLTIVELTVTLPVSVIIIVSLISILFSQYGSVLAESTRSSLRASGQALLTNLQDELLFTIEYGHTLNETLADPNDGGGWSYDTDPQTLIINETALDGARADTDRNIVRQRTVTCNSAPATANPVAVNNIIYFTEPNTETGYLNLYKRTVVPTYALCSIDRDTGAPCAPTTSTCLSNVKETTCPLALVGQNSCNKKDSLLSENVIDFTIRYYADNNVETTYPSAADKVEIDLLLGDKVYGRDVEVEVNHTIRKIN